jgi:hypothetical protein
MPEEAQESVTAPDLIGPCVVRRFDLCRTLVGMSRRRCRNSQIFLTTVSMPGSLTLAFIFLFIAASAAAQSSNPSSAQSAASAIPSIDGGIGPCTADFTIVDESNKPVYAAKINVHIAYGFVNARKLDLQIGTNVDGKAKFTGLPDRIRHGIYFHASEGDRSGEAFDDPANNCKAQFQITIRKQP